MPVFKLKTEDGARLSDARLGPPDWKPGDRIPPGADALEVVVSGTTTSGTSLFGASRHVNR
jgi:hypothetical protein